MSVAFAVVDPAGRPITPGSDADRGGVVAPDLDNVYKAEIRRLIGLGSDAWQRAAGEDLAYDAFCWCCAGWNAIPGTSDRPRGRCSGPCSSASPGSDAARLPGRAASCSLLQPPDTEWWDPDPELIDWHAALRALPPRMRACVVLFDGEDLSVADVAKALGCSPRTVEHQLHDARTKLADLVALMRKTEGTL